MTRLLPVGDEAGIEPVPPGERLGPVVEILAELELTGIRFTAPVFHGDTLYAFTEVLEKRDSDREDAGVVRFKHWGTKQDGKIVFEGERTVLIKRRSHWGNR